MAECNCHVPEGNLKPCSLHRPQRSPKYRAVEDILSERLRQDSKWGEQNHTPAFWMLILGEEFGEAQKAALEASFRDDCSWVAYRQELVQVAAVAIAAIESLDRNGPPPDERNTRALGVPVHG